MAFSDVVVIGAGVVGCAVAYELVSRGVSVTVVDSRGPGLGATQAAAGMLAPYVEGMGKPVLKLAARSLGMYDEFIDRVRADSGCAITYQRTGSLQVAMSDESLGELAAMASAAKTHGVECRLMDAAQTLDEEPQLTPETSGGLLIPAHGYVGSAELCAALMHAATKKEAQLRAPERVRELAPDGRNITVRFDQGSITASTVVLAGGSWSGQLQLADMPPLPVRPVRGQLVEIASSAPALRRITWGARCYLVPFGSTVLAGATMEEAGFDERTTVAGVHDLLDAASDLIPRIWQDSFAGARVGLRPATPDGLPIIGRSSRLPGLVYATGHFRNGVLLAPLTARLVADLLLDSREDELLGETSPGRFGEY